MAKEKPSGPAWEEWRSNELDHWAKHRKGSRTYFEFNGERWRLERIKPSGKPERFYPKSVDTKNTENKKVGGHREKMLEKQTAKDVDPRAAQTKRAEINRKGNEHHHINSRSRVEQGIQKKYGGEIPDHVRKQFADVDQYFGDDPRNFADLTIPEHRTGPNAVHKVEKRMDAAIKTAGSEADNIFSMFRKGVQAKSFRALGGITEYIQAVDELTGGHIDRGVQQGVNFFRQAVGQSPNPMRDTYNLQEGG